VHAALPSPPRDASFENDLRRFLEGYDALWQSAVIDVPESAITFTVEAQRGNERQADLLINSMEKKLRNYPVTERAQKPWRDRIFLSLRQMGTKSFRFPERHFDIIFSPDYLEATRAFAHQARAFDSGIGTSALAQAMRNVWVMNCLQMFLGRQPSLSKSVFAYSMLYPYTDNYLDQPSLSREDKETACHRLGLRLCGRRLEPSDAHEAAVFRLISMIEEEYPRDAHPAIYSSLLAIHAGQIMSLDQQCGLCAPETATLLRTSIEKGGSSVLADGWLVGGQLRREQAGFFFGFGVMLQLLDDLQDLTDDRRAGHWTLFTSAASSERLDSLTSRLWHFMHRMLEGTDCFSDPHGQELKDLIRRNSIMLMLRAVAENADLFSSDYLLHMERFSALSFSFLRDRRGEIEERFARTWSLVARRRNLHSIFELLG